MRVARVSENKEFHVQTYEDRDPRVMGYLKEMGRSAAKLRNSGEWQNFLEVQARFHNYSTNNQILIWSQNPDATYVAGYDAWRQMGMQVQKGEEGIRILAPSKYTVTDEDTGEKRKVIRGFHLVSVFDVTQCEEIEEDFYWKRVRGKTQKVKITNRFDPIPWPEPAPVPDGLFIEILKAVQQSDLDVEVVFAPISGEMRGYYEHGAKRITLKEDLAEATACTTLLHELGHALDPLIGTDENRARKELVAESSMTIVSRLLGIDTEADAEHYLASWGATEKQMIVVAKRVTEVVDQLRPVLMERPTPARMTDTPVEIDEEVAA